MENVLKVQAGFDRSLVETHRDSRRFLVAKIEAPQRDNEERSERAPIHVALVIDRSGSMARGRLDAAKQAAMGVADRLESDDYLSIVSFGDDVTVLLDSQRMDSGGLDQAHQQIEQIRTRGCTNLVDGWLAGAECLAKNEDRLDGHQKRLIVLSDGKANRGITDPREIAGHASELFRRGIVSSAVGIGDDYSPRQLAAIAEHGGGNLHDANDPEEIIDMVAGELDETLTMFADQVFLELDAQRGVQIECWNNYELKELGGRWECSLGSLPASRNRTVLLAVSTPSGHLGEELEFSLRVRWRRPGQDAFEFVEHDQLRLTYADMRANANQPRDMERTVDAARIWQSRVMREATEKNLAGDFHGAADVLEDALASFADLGREYPDAEEILRDLQKLKRHVQRRMGERTSKEVLFAASRSLKGTMDYRRGGRDKWTDQLDR